MANMVVRTNIFALNAHRNMKNVGLEQRRSSNRLSSGYRINSAADDAAGLAISETMRAQIRGLDQASRNAQDGQAMLLTTEGGLEEIGNMLQRVRELVVQAANDTNTQDQRTMIEQEVTQLSVEIASMQRRVEFNSNVVLNMGPALPAEINTRMANLESNANVVSNAFDLISANDRLITEAREILSRVSSDTYVSTLNERDRGILSAALAAVTFASAGTLTAAASVTITVGGTHAIPGVTIPALPAPITGIPAASIGLNGGQTITATEVAGMLNARETALSNAATSLNAVRVAMSQDADHQFGAVRAFQDFVSSGNNVAFFQVGANAGQGITYDFENVSRTVAAAAAVTNIVSLMLANPGRGSGIGRGLEVSPLISELTRSIDDVNSVRANLGAVQNRMDYTMRSLDISSENLQDSESRVRNADIAREMMRFTMQNVLQQASVSMLSQANQLPNNLLQLLR